VWRKLRIGLLLLILAIAAWSNWYDRLSTTDWDETLTVGIFPIDDADDSRTADYVARLATTDVAEVEAFLNEEAAGFGIAIARPVSLQMFPVVAEPPPERAPDSGMIGNMWWSLKMRMYARRASLSSGLPRPQIRIFVRYHNPEFTSKVPHSVGLQKGLVGVVHAFADRRLRSGNNVVIAHEILHTLGASDKYDLATLAPLFPAGYAEPERSPRYPQMFTEIMAGRYALTATRYEMPESLDEVVVGQATALEIRWVRE
jgi:hypothetical protein